MDIRFIEYGYLKKINPNGKIKRLFITELPKEEKYITHYKINNNSADFKFVNYFTNLEDLGYLTIDSFSEIIIDFEPSYDILEELKIISGKIFLWENMNLEKIKNLKLFEQ